MRTPLVAAFLGLSLVACTGVIGDGGPGGDDDDVPGPDCGNSVVNAGETCDDGNNSSGDGCSAACSTEGSPAMSMTVDKPTVMTELMTETMLTVTVTSSGGFSGPVTLTGSAIDAQSAPITGWTVTFDNASVDVPANGTATAVATVKIPSENMGLAGTIKIDGASSIGAKTAQTAVTVLDQVSLPMTLVDGQCSYPPVTSFKLTTGSKLRIVNNAARNVTFHMQGADNQPETNLSHQDDPGTPAGGVYEQTLTSTSGAALWWCHDPQDNNQGRLITAVPAQ